MSLESIEQSSGVVVTAETFATVQHNQRLHSKNHNLKITT
jgi:hypothetical protein